MMPSVTIASHLYLWVWHIMSLPCISFLMLSLFLPIFCLPENCPRSFKSFSSSTGGRKLYSAHLEFLWFLSKLPTYPLPPPGHAHRCSGDLSIYLCSRSSSCHVQSLKPENVEGPEGSETWFLLSAVFITECGNRLIPEPHQSTDQRVTREVVSRGSEWPSSSKHLGFSRVDHFANPPQGLDWC